MKQFDKKSVLDVMGKRGYGFVSENMSGEIVTKYNFTKHIESYILHASVDVKSESISLSFVDLMYFISLQTGRFAFDHKDFEKYEQLMVVYAAKCKDEDVFALLDSLKAVTPTKPPAKDIPTRKREFWDKIAAHGKEKGYTKEVCLSFYNYWTEMNDGGKKLKFEKQETFEISRRLVTWLQNEKKFTPAWKQKQETKVNLDQQDREVKKVNTKELF